MTDPLKLSRREREIMDILYSLGKSTTEEVRTRMKSPPGGNAVRALLVILEKKGYLKRQRSGKEYQYTPIAKRSSVGFKALQHVLETFYEGSFENALAAHLSRRKEALSPDDYQRLKRLIEDSEDPKC